jgi:hypothetical protein
MKKIKFYIVISIIQIVWWILWMGVSILQIISYINSKTTIWNILLLSIFLIIFIFSLISWLYLRKKTKKGIVMSIITQVLQLLFFAKDWVFLYKLSIWFWFFLNFLTNDIMIEPSLWTIFRINSWNTSIENIMWINLFWIIIIFYLLRLYFKNRNTLWKNSSS